MPTLSDVVMDLYFPQFNVARQQLSYRGIVIPCLFEQTFSSTDAGELLQEYQRTNGDNPFWQRWYSRSPIAQYQLASGLEPFMAQNVMRAEVQLTQVGDQVDNNWKPSDYGKYGYFRWLEGPVKGELQFITSRQQAFMNQPGVATGCEITLFDGCAGNLLLYQWAGVPPLIWKFTTDEEFSVFHGGYSYYGF